MTEHRRLIVMRHAKAEPYASTDHARRLTARGRADAAAAGARLVELGAVPQHAVVSTAERTRETWEVVARATGAGDVARFDRAVYGGGVEESLEALAATPASAATALLVGHNPTASDLCHLLDDGRGDPEALSGMLRGFPTSALAVFEVAAPWDRLGPERGRVVAFWAPSR